MVVQKSLQPSSPTTSSVDTKSDTPAYEVFRPVATKKEIRGYESILPVGEGKENASISSTRPKGCDTYYGERSEREPTSARKDIKKESRKSLDSKADKRRLLLCCAVLLAAMVLAGIVMFIIWHLQQDEHE